MHVRSHSPGTFTVARDRGDDSLTGAVVAIGNFDGVHRGHRAVMGAAQRRAAALKRPCAALTFSPHPRLVLRPQEPLFQLSDERSKLRLLSGAGLDGAIVMTFDAALSQVPAENFVQDILVGRYGISGAAIGFDFHFGKGRGGSPAFLQGEGARLGFSVDIVPPLEDNGRPVSSRAIRSALEKGDIAEANDLIGAPWFVSGEVIHGEKRGRALGYPTANIRLDPACGLRHGIYAVRAAVGGALVDGVASFGRRPTFDDGAPLLEIFLFGFSRDLYGKRLDVAFIGWIRPEVKFDGAEALKRQMDADSAQARGLASRAPAAFPVLGAI